MTSAVSGGGDCPAVWTIFGRTRNRGFFRCGHRHFLVKRNFGFIKIYVVSARTREGVKPVQTFFE